MNIPMSFICSAVLGLAALVPGQAHAASTAHPEGAVDCFKQFFQCYYLNGGDLITCGAAFAKCLASGSSVATLPGRSD